MSSCVRLDTSDTIALTLLYSLLTPRRTPILASRQQYVNVVAMMQTWHTRWPSSAWTLIHVSQVESYLDVTTTRALVRACVTRVIVVCVQQLPKCPAGASVGGDGSAKRQRVVLTHEHLVTETGTLP